MSRSWAWLVALVVSLPGCARRVPPEAPARSCLSTDQMQRGGQRQEPFWNGDGARKIGAELFGVVHDLRTATQAAAPPPDHDVCVPPVLRVWVRSYGPIDKLSAAGLRVESIVGDTPQLLLLEGELAPDRILELASLPQVVDVASTQTLEPIDLGPRA